jgi:LysR family transcriptional regulator, regulator of the ytmI operon
MFDLVDRSGVELRYLETFAAVLEAGTFLAAARALGCSQSTVTLHIQELERDLGLPLFQREGRRVRLTAAGESLRGVSQRVRDSVQALRRAADELREGGAGEVALGAVEPAASLRVTPVLAAFSRLRPRLRLRLEVSGTQTLSRQVAEGRLAFAVCSPPPASLGLSFQPCFQQRMALLLPRRHPLARQRRIRARDLASVRMLLTEHGCAYREATEAALRTRGVQVECALEIGSIVAAHAAVRDGLGLALVPVGPTLRAEAGLCLRELSDVDVTLVMGLARRDQPLATRAESALFAELSTALARG